MLKSTWLPVLLVALASGSSAQQLPVLPVVVPAEHGLGQGAWLHPGSMSDGLARGFLTDPDGNTRYSVDLVVESIQDGYGYGRVRGVLQDAALVQGGLPPPLHPVLIVDGIWLPTGASSGEFTAHILPAIETASALVIGMLEGAFELDEVAPTTQLIDLSGRRLARYLAVHGLHPSVFNAAAAADINGLVVDEADPSIVIITCPWAPELDRIEVLRKAEPVVSVPLSAYYLGSGIHPAALGLTLASEQEKQAATPSLATSTRRGRFSAIWYLDV